MLGVPVFAALVEGGLRFLEGEEDSTEKHQTGEENVRAPGRPVSDGLQNILDIDISGPSTTLTTNAEIQVSYGSPSRCWQLRHGAIRSSYPPDPLSRIDLRPRKANLRSLVTGLTVREPSI